MWECVGVVWECVGVNKTSTFSKTHWIWNFILRNIFTSGVFGSLPSLSCARSDWNSPKTPHKEARCFAKSPCVVISPGEVSRQSGLSQLFFWWQETFWTFMSCKPFFCSGPKKNWEWAICAVSSVLPRTPTHSHKFRCSKNAHNASCEWPK